MSFNAYILAADPTWIEASVGAYYGHAGRIVVSYDESGRGWTGARVAMAECLRRLKAMDANGKMVFRPGNYAAAHTDPLVSDTRQRQAALDEASDGADWVLQLDTDEYLPNWRSLMEMIGRAERDALPAVEWPMRVLFHRHLDGRFLEVCAAGGGDRFEYPGPVAVRPGVRLVDARRTDGPFLRPIVAGDDRSLQITRPAAAGERRVAGLDRADAIVHNSWARRPASIRSKIASWGHNSGLRTRIFYHLRWRPAPYIWRWMRDFHPFARGLWPALKPCEHVPPGLQPPLAPGNVA